MGTKYRRFYKSALEYHLKHDKIADTAGKFIANINIGIIQELLGNKEKAMEYHQIALQYALELSNIEGQKIAIGNLGRIGIE